MQLAGKLFAMLRDKQPAPMEDQEDDISRVLSQLLSDEELSDLTLEGSDGEQIKTNRCILAVRSKVFRAMLFGNYSEAKRSVIKVEYKGRVLKAVVDYCYTDHADLFDEISCDDSWARAMVQLAAAADFFGLSLLRKKVLDQSEPKMEEKPGLACSFFDEAEAIGDTDHSQMALNCIRIKGKNALLTPSNGILSLRPAALSKILQDSQLDMDELTRFRALQEWSDAKNTVDTVQDGKEDGSVPHCSKKRKDVASGLTEHIQLERIKPSDLSDIVIPSGLAAQDQLLEAFQAQALLLEKKKTLISTNRLACWKNSTSSSYTNKNHDAGVTVQLNCEPMTSGIHRWRIKITMLPEGFEVGVGVCAVTIQSSGVTQDHWYYLNDGRAYVSKKHTPVRFPPYDAGSVITFTLDLTGNGSLTASVDGNDPFQLFDGMLESVDGFVPSVGLRFGGSVRFMGFLS
jgi:hypothetical protein